jgi:hypothetical protein
MRYVIAKKTSVSMIVDTIIPTEEYGFASLLTHLLVGSMCAPLIANGTVKLPHVESHIMKKAATTNRSP